MGTVAARGELGLHLDQVPSGENTIVNASELHHQPERLPKPRTLVRFLPRALCCVARHPGRVWRDIPDNLCMLAGSVLGLVVLGRVDGELGEELAVFVDDAHVAVGDEQDDAGSGEAARPRAMWWSRPWWRTVTVPPSATRSRRTRQWVSARRSAGVALGRAA